MIKDHAEPHDMATFVDILEYTDIRISVHEPYHGAGKQTLASRMVLGVNLTWKLEDLAYCNISFVDATSTVMYVLVDKSCRIAFPIDVYLLPCVFSITGWSRKLWCDTMLSLQRQSNIVSIVLSNISIFIALRSAPANTSSDFLV